jgi:hypothetical protein
MVRNVRRSVVALLLLAACAAPLPRRLADGDPKAEEEWEGLTPERQLEVMREGLRGGDPEARRVAAAALDPMCLTLEEIRLQMAVLAARPLEIEESPYDWTSSHPLPVGSPDLPAIWKASTKAECSDALVRTLVELHRASLPSHIPALVALLPDANSDLLPVFLWQLALLADETDEYRGDVARGLIYVLGRIRSERPGGPPPRPLPIHIDEREAFLTLAEATWGLAPDGGFGKAYLEPAKVWAMAPSLWLHRWAKDVRLVAADRPFLARVVREAEPRQARVWAARRLGQLGDDATLRKIAAGDEDVALVAAAELAKRGDRTRLEELLQEEPSLTLLWFAAPEQAREAWTRQCRELVKDAKDAIERGEAWSPWLLIEKPDETEAEWGIRIAPEDLSWIGEQLVALDAPPETLALHYLDRNPDALTAEAARGVLARLSPMDPYSLEDFLGLCEVRDRAAVVETLDRWAGTEEAKTEALLFLARLGETARAEEMIAARDDDPEWWAIGRVRDPRVAAFLEEKAKGDDPPTALDGLATFHGLEQPGFAQRSEFIDADWAEEPFAGARRLIVEGKPVEAVIRLAERDDLAEWAAAALAGSRDPAAIAFLRRMREERWRGVYWVATAALATSGDADAMAEWRAFLAEDRTWMIDSLQGWNTRRWSILTAGGDEALVRHWVSRINTNCCQKFYAYCALFGLYPTIALENEGPGDWGQKGKAIAAWLDGHTFRKSEILGGFVPGASIR